MKVLIADDHPVIREGVTQIIESQADMKVVAPKMPTKWLRRPVERIGKSPWSTTQCLAQMEVSLSGGSRPITQGGPWSC